MGLSLGTKGLLPIKNKKASTMLESLLRCIYTYTFCLWQPVAFNWCFRKVNQRRKLYWNPTLLKVCIKASGSKMVLKSIVKMYKYFQELHNMIWFAAMEVEASHRGEDKTTCSTDMTEFVQHMVKEYNEDYKVKESHINDHRHCKKDSFDSSHYWLCFIGISGNGKGWEKLLSGHTKADQTKSGII